MSAELNVPSPINTATLPEETAFKGLLGRRQARGRLWSRFFSLSTVVAILALLALLGTIINDSFGYVIVEYAVDPATLAPDGDLESLSARQLAQILVDNNKNLGVTIRDTLSVVPADQFSTATMRQVAPNAVLPEGTADKTFRELTPEEVLTITADNVPSNALLSRIEAEVTRSTVREAYTLIESLTQREQIEAAYLEDYGGAENTGSAFFFRNWLNVDYVVSGQTTNPTNTGIRSAIIGTVLIMAITVAFSFTVGVSAAIYLEEYAVGRGWFARFIETNIRNLAGVPSIIYGLLGLAVFVRLLEGVTQGRTILSAALTMGLLVLPVIIINAQEALRSVPPSMREASFGLGATRWQTIWRTVLPAALPGILTGTILAMSRAIGETAPLIVIGAATTIFVDPNGAFSKFTALPIQIYQWTARPQEGFRQAAAAGIIVLLALLLALNATAIILRQRVRKGLQS
jgi:phosphate transport system permease protein